MIAINSTVGTEYVQQARLNKKVVGNPFSVGNDFNALSFRHSDFKTGFDPLIMVDHYRMNGPTFGAHPHAGLSAVSIIFEDSKGKFHNRDSLGNDFDLEPGDLYWLKAGSGVFHDEEPRVNSRIHGLQVFVNMPNKDKGEAPDSLHIKAKDIPVINEQGARVRVLLGTCNGVTAGQSPSTPLTILDGTVKSCKHFDFVVDEGDGAWMYAVTGTLQIEVGKSIVVLKEGTSFSLSSCEKKLNVRVVNIGLKDSHFAVLSGKPLNESFVQQGPLVAADAYAMQNTLERKERGLFGAIKSS